MKVAHNLFCWIFFAGDAGHCRFLLSRDRSPEFIRSSRCTECGTGTNDPRADRSGSWTTVIDCSENTEPVQVCEHSFESQQINKMKITVLDAA